MQQVNEQSTAYLTVTFRNKAGVAEAPATAKYRIDDVASGSAVLGETAITPVAATVEVRLTPANNTLLVAGNPAELRRVTVIGEYGQDDAVTSEYLYEVVNLSGVS